MPKITKPTEDDQEEFHSAMKGVKPLVHTKRLYIPPPVKRKVKKASDYTEQANLGLSDYETLPSVTSEEKIEYAEGGIPHKTLRKLRTGYYTIEAILDLHGKTVSEAREALDGFLVTCQRQQLRHVLIIHGKGRGDNKPILKNKLNHWLRQVNFVIAFCSATAKHGKQGALYVLMRRIGIG